ncbi:hypothetical protein [Streptomyces sp. NPDC058086]|uniref:hypothetical protein n=1 Tax=Streptomyces sp. NPDC058086 TaxID=3346334 RepID=UPI0036EC9735
MRNREKALSVLEALGERGRATGHGWVLNTESLLPHQQSVNALESPGLVELAGREVRAEPSALEGRPVWWAARVTPYGHDTLTYAHARPQPRRHPVGPGQTGGW